MKKHLLILIFLISISKYSLSQTTFQKTFGGTNDDVGYCVQQTMDGGYIIVGKTLSFGAGNYDVYLIKTNSYGDVLWKKTFGGTSSDIGLFVKQTTDGGYIITGNTYSFNSSSGREAYLIKTDSGGNLLWTRNFGDTGKLESGNVVDQTSDGGYIIAGSAELGFGNFHALLIKTDANGDTLWTKIIQAPDDSYANSVLETNDGSYIIGGQTYNATNSTDIHLIKTDASGNPIWKKIYGGSHADQGGYMKQTFDGNYIIAGATSSFGSGFNTNFLLIKTDSSGNILWTKTFGSLNTDFGYDVQVTTDGGFIIAGISNFGSSTDKVYLVKTDVNGDTLWTKNYGGVNADGAYSIRQTTDGGYIIAGRTKSSGQGNSDVYLLKTDSLGNIGCNELAVTTNAFSLSFAGTVVSTPLSSGISTAIAAWAVDSGGIATTPCTSVGVNQIATDNLFLIFPNPANDIITINSKNNYFATEIILYYASGREVMKKNLNKEASFSVRQLNAGIYFYKMKNAKGNEVRGKVVKE
jgi:hypothetical protein